MYWAVDCNRLYCGVSQPGVRENICSFSNLSVTSPTSHLILQPFFRFCYVTWSSWEFVTIYRLKISKCIELFIAVGSTAWFPNLGTARTSAHSPTFPSLHLRHSSFSNPSVPLHMSQLILQPFRCFTYVTAHSPTLLSLLLRHRLFTCVTWRTPPWEFVTIYRLKISKCIELFIAVGSTAGFPNLGSARTSAHSPTFPSLHLRHSSFSNPSITLSTSKLILQPFRCFTYVTAHSPTLLSLLLRHRLFTCVTWRNPHGSS